MRSPRLLGLIALTVPVLLLPAACEDSSSSSSGGTFAPEAGPGFDAGGNPDTFVPPTPIPDAAVDQFVAPKGVTVKVLDAAAPKSGVRVIAHDASGAVVGDAMTDATGRVAFANAPSMVSVLASSALSGTSMRYTPVTFMAVADGDNLVVVVPLPFGQPVTLATFDVGFTPSALVAKAAMLGVYTDGLCYGSSASTDSTASITLTDGCANTQNAVLATATDTSSNVLGFGFAKNLPKPAANATVAVGPLAFSAPGSTTITASNVPLGSTSTYAQLNAIANESSFAMSYYSGSLGDGGLDFPTPVGFADAYQSKVYSRGTAKSGMVDQVLVRRDPAAAAALPLAFDFSTALPLIATYALSNPTPRPDLVVTGAAPLTGADAGFVSIDWSTGTGSATWLFVVPGTMTSFKAPALPADATNFIPAASASVDTAIFFDASQLPGYSAVKALPIPTERGFGIANPTDDTPLPAAGTVRITRYIDNSKG